MAYLYFDWSTFGWAIGIGSVFAVLLFWHNAEGR